MQLTAREDKQPKECQAGQGKRANQGRATCVQQGRAGQDQAHMCGLIKTLAPFTARMSLAEGLSTIALVSWLPLLNGAACCALLQSASASVQRRGSSGYMLLLACSDS